MGNVTDLNNLTIFARIYQLRIHVNGFTMARVVLVIVVH
jgi:hypothetical protein